ncbi:hypothetical protein DMENIID0001_136090 [Sergentomyia squamirostris]
MGENAVYKSVYWKTMGSAFSEMLSGEKFVDVTLVCEGHRIQCHRIVLAACSHFFEDLLKDLPAGQYPVIILPKDVKFWMIQALLEFMYQGEVNVAEDGIDELGKCAEILQIRCISGCLQPSSDEKTELIDLIESQPELSDAPFNQTVQEDLLIPVEMHSKKRKIDEDPKDHEENQLKSSTSVSSGPKDDTQQGYKLRLRRKSAIEWEIEDREDQSEDTDSDLEKSWPSFSNFEVPELSQKIPKDMLIVRSKCRTRGRNFKDQDIKDALMDIQNGKSVQSVIRKYNISNGSIFRYMKLNNIKSIHSFQNRKT